MPAETKRTALYRLYDSSEVLLYVGISTYPDERLKQHAGDKLWWHHVARQEITWLDSRAEALKAEAEAIANERPLYNGYHHLGKGWPQKAREYDDTAERAMVLEGVRSALARGEYAPDTYLSSATIGQQFGVSSTVAFHALNELVKEGVMTKRHQHFRVPK
ncbi:GntR family transcriptional regulator [Streptomyces asoensis]|uniref:GntR family transcriptional regulator n=1 Tax=Streptomyces asoensis TaxID=249586 RepID=UPI0033167BF3